MDPRPRRLSVCVLYYVSLALYVRIPGIYLLPSRKRIAVWSAGVVTNLFLAAGFMILSSFSSGDLRLSLFIGVFVNLMMAVNSLMPFMCPDGYCVLSTVLKMPNLRKSLCLASGAGSVANGGVELGSPRVAAGRLSPRRWR